jgi:hypothetical protein
VPNVTKFGGDHSGHIKLESQDYSRDWKEQRSEVGSDLVPFVQKVPNQSANGFTGGGLSHIAQERARFAAPVTLIQTLIPQP